MRLLLVLLLVHATLGSRSLDKQALRENLQRCRDHPCLVPQERVVSAYRELMRRGEINPRHAVFPRRVVLHRCERSGCCLDVIRPCCSSVATSNVSLLFNVVDKVQNKYEPDRTFVFVNHTACECSSRE